jgi:hypothetical protein
MELNEFEYGIKGIKKINMELNIKINNKIFLKSY